MKKYISKILIFLILLISCNRPDNKETIDEFIIYGYSGFCLKDSVNRKYDSTKLNIRQYFEFQRDSFFRMALRSYYEKNFGFYTIHSIDTIGFNDLLDKILLNKNFNKEYYSEKPEIYDGYIFSMYFKTNYNKITFIHYTPNHLPDSLRILHDYFNKSIENEPLLSSMAFELKEISTKEVIELHIKHPPPPPPENLELRVKFTAQKKKKKDTIALNNTLDSTINLPSRPR
jgi:hypothetical protein